MNALSITTTLAFVLTIVAHSVAQLTPAYDDIMIPMSDGEALAADVYIPSGCTSCEAILVQTPYNKEMFEAGLPLGIGTNLDAQPYIWVVVDWRGFYGSNGADLTDVDRGQDGYDVCDWITAQSWHGSRIGTWGPSALGNIQWQLIGKHHPNHTCAVPIVSDPQFAYTSYFYGGVLEEARLQQLDALGYGLSPIVMANTYYSNIWQFAESSTYFPNQIEIPTLQIGGWYDHNIDEMMTFYKQSRNEALLSVRDEQWLLIGPWVHGGTGIAFVGSSIQGELTYPNAALVNNDMAWDFFDYYLSDSVNGWNTTAPITYYELGNDIWHTSTADDIAVANTEDLFLNPGNQLSSMAGISSSTFTSDPANPTPTIGGATLHPTLDQGPYDQSALDARSDLLTFETDALPQDISSTGRILLTLYVSATQPDCDIAVRLVDQYPNGDDMLITDGIKRMRFRNGYTTAAEAFMTPGQVYEVEVDLPFTNYTWLAGHKIKIYVSGNNAIRWDVNMQDGGTMYTSTTPVSSNITIHHDATYPSRITIPGNNPVLAVNENPLATPVEIYPNPAQDQLTVKTGGSFDKYLIQDMSGRTVAMGKLSGVTISVASLQSGMYLLKLTDETGIFTEKRFVKD
ncbi:MAG: CocE/NonD family hydrolase [Bacteroidota bacterium]